jgi:hypothetical protein
MEVSGHLHTPAALPPGKEPAFHIGQKAGWDPEPVWTLWSREYFLDLAGNGTPAFQPVARRYID